MRSCCRGVGGVPCDDGAWLLTSSCRSSCHSSATYRLPATNERARGSRTKGGLPSTDSPSCGRRTGDGAERPSRGALRGSGEANADVGPNLANADVDPNLAGADVDPNLAGADADPASPASATKELPTMLPRLSRAKRALRVSSTCKQACKQTLSEAIRGSSEGHQRAIRGPSEVHQGGKCSGNACA